MVVVAPPLVGAEASRGRARKSGRRLRESGSGGGRSGGGDGGGSKCRREIAGVLFFWVFGDRMKTRAAA